MIVLHLCPSFHISPARVYTRVKSAPLESPQEPQEGRITAGRLGRRMRRKRRRGARRASSQETS